MLKSSNATFRLQSQGFKSSKKALMVVQVTMLPIRCSPLPTKSLTWARFSQTGPGGLFKGGPSLVNRPGGKIFCVNLPIFPWKRGHCNDVGEKGCKFPWSAMAGERRGKKERWCSESRAVPMADSGTSDGRRTRGTRFWPHIHGLS